MNRERNAKSILRRERNALESVSEKADRLEREARIKKSKCCDQNDNDTIETRLRKRDSHAKRKTMLRRLKSLNETEEEHNKRLRDNSLIKAANQLNRDLLVRNLYLQFYVNKKILLYDAIYIYIYT